MGSLLSPRAKERAPAAEGQPEQATEGSEGEGVCPEEARPETPLTFGLPPSLQAPAWGPEALSPPGGAR